MLIGQLLDFLNFPYHSGPEQESDDTQLKVEQREEVRDRFEACHHSDEYAACRGRKINKRVGHSDDHGLLRLDSKLKHERRFLHSFYVQIVDQVEAWLEIYLLILGIQRAKERVLIVNESELFEEHRFVEELIGFIRTILVIDFVVPDVDREDLHLCRAVDTFINLETFLPNVNPDHGVVIEALDFLVEMKLLISHVLSLLPIKAPTYVWGADDLIILTLKQDLCIEAMGGDESRRIELGVPRPANVHTLPSEVARAQLILILVLVVMLFAWRNLHSGQLFLDLIDIFLTSPVFFLIVIL